MHVAICDDNIADRKQMERLLGRLSDRLAAESEPLYVDSFGNPEALLAAQLHYGVYFIDLTNSQLNGQKITGYEMAQRLMESGIESTFYLCCGQIDYRLCKLQSHMFCISKPIENAALAEAVQNALKEAAEMIPHITLHGVADGTHYVKMQDIVYCRQDKDNHTTLFLTDGSTLRVGDNVYNLFLNLESQYPCLHALSGRLLVNRQHLSSVSFRSITFDTGKTIKIGIPAARYAYNALRGHGRKLHFKP